MSAPNEITLEAAEICADFIVDNNEAVPPYVMVAVEELRATLNDPAAYVPVYLSRRVQAALEQWLYEDRAACVAALGPGLGPDFEDEME